MHLQAQSFPEKLARLETMLGQAEVFKEMRLLWTYLDAMGIAERVHLDTALARGLDYYTGFIFEAVLGSEAAHLGSVAAGGRYDHLIGMFSKAPIPSAGGSLGIERIFNLLEEKSAKEDAPLVDAVVGQIGSSVPKEVILKIASWLWDHGLRTDIGYEGTSKVGE